MTETPVRLLESLSRRDSALWVKHDDRTNPLYGGNKVRKIERLLEHAKRSGKTSLVTIGALGSHHVLATGIFGAAAGFLVEAVVVPQPSTPHVLEMLRADLARGIRLFPAATLAEASLLLAARIARGRYFIPLGGSNELGASGYVEAAHELAGQVARGELPEPDLVVVPMGSGGTAAGLAAGFASLGLRTRVLAVTVTEPPWLLERSLRRLTARLAGSHARDAQSRLETTRSYLGGGYGLITQEGDRAALSASQVGLHLEPTYTAKAFAAALDRVALGRERTILYWHTFSSAPMAPLLEGAPEDAAIDPKLLRLARRSNPPR